MRGSAHPVGGCEWAPRHLPVVIYTRSWRQWFRKRFVVKCWGFCDLELGPFPTWAMAELERKQLEES